MPEELLEEDAGCVRMGSVAEEEAEEELPEIPEEVGVKEGGEGGEGEVPPLLATPAIMTTLAAGLTCYTDYTCCTNVAPSAPHRRWRRAKSAAFAPPSPLAPTPTLAHPSPLRTQEVYFLSTLLRSYPTTSYFLLYVSLLTTAGG